MAVSASQALNLKIPPHSHEAESAVLGTLMTDNSSWEKIGDLISPEDFYKPEHKLNFIYDWYVNYSKKKNMKKKI